MHLSPATSLTLCLALLLLIPQTRSTTTTGAPNAAAPCAPAWCGDLAIAYPFWLAGTHPPECGGHQAFQVTCDNATAYFKNSLWTYRIQAIFYEMKRIRVTNADLLDGACNVDKLANASSVVDPFYVSSEMNQELFFLHGCNLRAQQLPPSWAPLRCANGSFAWLSGQYRPDDDSMTLPGNCNVSMVPVMAYDGATGSDYQRLVEGGFMLEYFPEGCEGCRCPDGVTCGTTERAHRKITIIGSTAAAASLLVLCICVLIWKRKVKQLWFLLGTKTMYTTERNTEALIASHGSLAPKRYRYTEVANITSSLNNKLGEGGYGTVFKGRLYDGRLVAVKFLHECKANGDEFVNEVMSIGRTSHVNIVSLFGFCLERTKRALIYEYMPNGSLDQYIYSENPKETLGWQKLYTIAIGIARGLEYLHHSCNTRIVHFDIKPQNILLDQDFCPKISDFGLAKLCHTKESKLSMTGARGTIGFIAPEVHSRTFGVVSTKSDVYSYGMMLLEMVGGRKNVKSMAQKSSEKYFPHWIYDHFTEDDGLQACEVTSEADEIAKKMTLIGFWCIQVLPVHRPTITKVLEMFERGLDSLDMPPRQNFSQILEDSVYRLDTESRSPSSSTKTQGSFEEINLGNGKIL
ncbi:hypothetical protein PAHAL_5G466800 [Panicum hallii]|uniref:Protein kinase domain-containing protein n=1 Tax=Panicum hallii TaxID=206008 RepID=A0A2T8INL6_9POAL|nr:LEAF RUST 10 DISEASE-RESISTANCE LOCUS RECEPTOR-LIKE PROTEIN KINASE-like 2.5 [Panicum hallii]PVH39263.1 hypothetical protein PAHAL_5G466800 [Panicum hallii]